MRITRWLIIVSLLVVGLGFCAAVVRQWNSPRVLLVTLGAVRADALFPWQSAWPMGDAQPLAPALAHLCTVGVCFTQAYSNTPYARAAAATLLTGRLSAEHGVRGPLDQIAPEVPQLPELFAAAGYDTGAVVGSAELAVVFGFRGFALYDDRFTAPIVGWDSDPLPVPALTLRTAAWQRSARRSKWERNARKPDSMTTDAALAFLARHRARPFFLWVHYFAASPIWPSEGMAVPSWPAYAERVREADRELKRLLQGLVRLKLDYNTWLVVHGDSGFALLEHGDYGVGMSLYEPSVRVPLIIVPPRNVAHKLGPRRVDTPVSLRDLSPTLVAVAGLPVSVPWPSRGLGAWLSTKPPAGEEKEQPVPLETYLTAGVGASREVRQADGKIVRVGQRIRGVRWRQWKYLLAEPHPLVDTPEVSGELVGENWLREELYDLSVDPRETQNLAAAQPQVTQALRASVPPL